MYGGAGLMPSEFFDQGGKPDGDIDVDSTSGAVSTPSTIAVVIGGEEEAA